MASTATETIIGTRGANFASGMKTLAIKAEIATATAPRIIHRPLRWSIFTSITHRPIARADVIHHLAPYIAAHMPRSIAAGALELANTKIDTSVKKYTAMCQNVEFRHIAHSCCVKTDI